MKRNRKLHKSLIISTMCASTIIIKSLNPLHPFSFASLNPSINVRQTIKIPKPINIRPHTSTHISPFFFYINMKVYRISELLLYKIKKQRIRYMFDIPLVNIINTAIIITDIIMSCFFFTKSPQNNLIFKNP